VQTNIYDEVAWYIARHVVCLQSYRPMETVWCNRFTQQNPKPKLVSVFLNRLRPKPYFLFSLVSHTSIAYASLISVHDLLFAKLLTTGRQQRLPVCKDLAPRKQLCKSVNKS